MTKKEFQQKFGDKAAELLANPTYHIALDVAREDCPHLDDKSIDATSIIRNEGKIQGWNGCLKFLKSLAKSEPEPPKPVEAPRYQDPDSRKSDQNKK